MRFCTTHRACEVDYGGICEVSACGGYWADAPCTLVDALIIEKVDGEWPKWWLDALWEWVGKLNENAADALERAEPYARLCEHGFFEPHGAYEGGW